MNLVYTDPQQFAQAHVVSLASLAKLVKLPEMYAPALSDLYFTKWLYKVFKYSHIIQR